MYCVEYESEHQLYVLQFNGGFRFFTRSGDDYTNFASNDGYVLCIEAAGLTVEEGYRDGWNRLFKGQHLEILNAFDKVWPVTGWGVVDFELWLHEREQGGMDQNENLGVGSLSTQ